ncbi:MAG: DUF177 domain-containing protein [Alphaproteobacteria bacterium]
MTKTNAPARIEFSRPVSTEGITEKGIDLTVEADAAECAALARRFDLKGLHRLKAELRLVPDRESTLRLEGHLTASVVQTCVVTLADVTATIDERFSLRFSPEAPVVTGQGAVFVSVDEEDPPEPLVGNTIDLGEVVAEQLALALDPYPRLPGATFTYALPEKPENEEVASPFRKLVGLKEGK